MGGAAQSVRGNYKPFKGINLTVLYICMLHIDLVN